MPQIPIPIYIYRERDHQDKHWQPRSKKTKEGYEEQLQAHKNTFTRMKGCLEGLYSIYNGTKDTDLEDSQRLEIQTEMDKAESIITSYNGALKPLKLTLEPC